MTLQNQVLSPKLPSDVAGLMSRSLLLIETYVEDNADSLESMFVSQKVELLGVLNSTRELLTKVQELQPDVLVLAVDFLDAETLDQLLKINEVAPLPVTVFAKHHAPEVLKPVVAAGVSSYVVDDITAHRLSVIIDLSAMRFVQAQSLNNELKEVKEKLKERKLLERAKGIIMNQNRLSEAEAYAQMRRSAMNQGQSMAELSKRVIAVFEMHK